MEEITIRYWSPHGRQEEKRFSSDNKKIDLTMRAARKIDLSNLRRCTKLVILNLATNMLEELNLSPLSGNSTLSEIYLENNHLRALNLWPLGTCRSMTRLNLTHNRLQSLDLTPILARSYVLLDSSVVISADNILRFLFTTKELGERFLLVRPDRAPWTAPPVLIWVSYDELEKKMEWSGIRERITTVLKQISKNDWYPVQRGLLSGLGMEELAGFDGDPSKLLDNTDDSMDYDTAKRAIFDRTIELLDEQITNNGPTMFLDTEAMKETRASRLIVKIIEARKREMENATVLTKGSTSLMNSLWLTHYGFKILDALNVGVRHFGAELEDVRKSLDDLGFVLKTREVDSLETANIEDPVVCSQSMRKHILNLIEDAYL
ncbi:MAG: hypothetical protein PVJ05_13570 [Candidatus Thorarchaeota archaeon]|jgi:hypothetical protein